eukprot:sb/3471130/
MKTLSFYMCHNPLDRPNTPGLYLLLPNTPTPPSGIAVAHMFVTALMFKLGDWTTYGLMFGVSTATTTTHVKDVLFPKVVACRIAKWGASGLENETGRIILAKLAENMSGYLLSQVSTKVMKKIDNLHRRRMSKPPLEFFRVNGQPPEMMRFPLMESTAVAFGLAPGCLKNNVAPTNNLGGGGSTTNQLSQ